MATVEIHTALLVLAEVKAEEAALALRKAAAEQQLIDALRAKGQKTVSTVLTTGDTVKGTLVESQTLTLDEERLHKQLTPSQWKKVTVQVLDRGLLEAAVAVNVIDPNIVAGCSTLSDRKAYVRVTGTFSTDDIKASITAFKPVPKAKVRARRPSAAAKAVNP